VKGQIQTHPQFHVVESPSARERYPLDIVVFNDKPKDYDNVFMLIECKQKTRKDGRAVLWSAASQSHTLIASYRKPVMSPRVPRSSVRAGNATVSIHVYPESTRIRKPGYSK
jgi:hypothetical protein